MLPKSVLIGLMGGALVAPEIGNTIVGLRAEKERLAHAYPVLR